MLQSESLLLTKIRSVAFMTQYCLEESICQQVLEAFSRSARPAAWRELLLSHSQMCVPLHYGYGYIMMINIAI